MRYHREHRYLQAWIRSPRFRELARDEHVKIARIEPVVNRGNMTVQLDLTFYKNGLFACVPGIFVDERALLIRTSDPFIWPEEVAHLLEDETVSRIQNVVLPWVSRMLTARGLTGEQLGVFHGSEVPPIFARARELRCLGAAPLASYTQDIVGAKYAGSFAFGASVLVGTSYLNIAPLLAHLCSRAHVADTSAAEQEVLTAWFGQSFAVPKDGADAYDIVIGDALDWERHKEYISHTTRCIALDGRRDSDGVNLPYLLPIAVDEMLCLHEEREQGRQIKVLCEEVPAEKATCAQWQPMGGSAGNIVLVLRPDAFIAEGADLDEALALKRALLAEGFEAHIAVQPNSRLFETADLIHVIGLQDPSVAVSAIKTAARRHVPCVVTAMFENGQQGARWGAMASRSLTNLFMDDTDFDRGLSKLAERKIDVDGISADMMYDDGFDRDRHVVLSKAQVIIVSGTAEEQALRDFCPAIQNIAHVLPYLDNPREIIATAHLVPNRPYVLIHSPIEARYNLTLALRAVSQVDLPCVVVGKILDRRLYSHLQSIAPLTTVFLPEIDTRTSYALYSRASLLFDPAWIADGISRLLRAALHSSKLLVATHRLLPEIFEAQTLRFDPASLMSMQTTLAHGWQQGGDAYKAHPQTDIAALSDPEQTFRRIIRCYAEANTLAGHKGVVKQR